MGFGFYGMHGFWVPWNGYWIQGSGLWIPMKWILDSMEWVLDSRKWIIDSKEVNSGFHRMGSGFKGLDYGLQINWFWILLNSLWILWNDYWIFKTRILIESPKSWFHVKTNIGFLDTQGNRLFTSSSLIRSSWVVFFNSELFVSSSDICCLKAFKQFSFFATLSVEIIVE